MCLAECAAWELAAQQAWRGACKRGWPSSEQQPWRREQVGQREQASEWQATRDGGGVAHGDAHAHAAGRGE